MLFLNQDYRLLEAELFKLKGALRKLIIVSEYIENYLQRRRRLVQQAPTLGLLMDHIDPLWGDARLKEIYGYFYLAQQIVPMVEELILLLTLLKKRRWLPTPLSNHCERWVQELERLFLEIDLLIKKLRRL